MTSASKSYIARSTPSTRSAPGSTAASPRPTKSPTMRNKLTQIHDVSDGAAKLSRKATTMVQGAVGSIIPSASSSATKPSSKAATLIQRAIGSGSSSSSSSADKAKSKGRSSTDPEVKSPMPQPQSQSPQQPPTGTAPAPLRTRSSISLSAALVLATIEASAVRLVETGGAAVSEAVTHKFGPTAGENVALVGRTARNIVLVYVDVRGLGRRVIVKRVAKTWVSGRMASARREAAALVKSL
jgi:spartin